MSSANVTAFDLDRVVDEFLERHRRGEKPTIKEYQERYPEHAEEIDDVLQALEWMEDLGPIEQTTSPGQRAMLLPLDTDIPKLLGDYRLVREIGRGGMGVVYEAVQESLGRHVALKVLPPQFVRQGNYIERFRREAQAAARLHHTNIVPVFGVGEQQGVYFYAMQFIQGQTLASVLDEVKRLRAGNSAVAAQTTGSVSKIVQAFHTDKYVHKPALIQNGTSTCELNEAQPVSPQINHATTIGAAPSTAVAAKETTMQQGRGHYYRSITLIARQVAHALAYAHERGIIHRDIKPNNLLIDERGTAWVTDFGLAKELESNDLTATGDIVGTLRYMAPELFEGKSDHRADIYGLGITLYEMATLRPAFDDKNRGKLITRIRQEEPNRPRRIDAQIPLDLETIILKATAKEPPLRYQSATEMARDLELFLADRPIQARRIGWWEQGWRWCRRNPVVAGMTGIVMCLVILLATVSSVAAIWLGNALNTSEGHRQDALLAKQETQLQLSKAYLAEAQANRISRRVGQRFHSLSTIKQSHELLKSLNVSSEEALTRRDALRNEATAALALPDLKKIREFGSWPAGSQDLDIDARFEHYVRSNTQDCSISVRKVANDEEVHHFATVYSDKTGINPVLSPDSRILTAIAYIGYRLKGWLLDTPEPILFLDEPAVKFIRNVSYSPDGACMAFAASNQQLVVVNCRTKERRSFPIPDGQPYRVCFHPSGQQLAVAVWHNERTVIQIRRPDDGTLVGQHVMPFETGSITHFEWNPDGERMAAAGNDENIYLWSSQSAKPTILTGHKTSGITFAFNHAGNLMASVDHAGCFFLRDVDSGQILLSHLARWPVRFSDDDRFLITQREIWEFAAGNEYRTFISRNLSPQGKLLQPQFDEHSRLLTAGGTHGPLGWDLQTKKEVFHMPYLGWTRSITQDQQSKSWITSGDRGLNRWRWRQDTDQQTILGPPVLLSNAGNITDFEISNDGKMIVQAGIDQGALVHHLSEPRRVVQSEFRLDVRLSALHPNGQLAAACSWNGTDAGVHIFDTQTGRTLTTLPVRDRSRLLFSPDGQWLLTVSEDGSRLWKVASWKCIRELGHAESAAFNKDGTVLALGTRPHIRLVDPATGHELVRLEDPNQEATRCLAFNKDATLLAASSESTSIRVWDLRAIREQLSELGLDWHAASYSQRQTNSSLTSVSIDLGNQLNRLLPAGNVITLTSIALAFQPLNHLARYGRAVALHEQQRNDLAIDELNTIIQFHPRFMSAYYSRGYILRREGQLDKAIADLSVFLRTRPRDLAAARERAMAYQGKNDLVHAVEDLRTVCELDPKDSLAHNNLAWYLVMGPAQVRNPAEALPYAEKAYQLSPRVVSRNTLAMVYYRLQQYQKALPLLEQNVKEKHEELGVDLYLMAIACLHCGDTVRAKSYYEQANAWKPGETLGKQQYGEWEQIRDEAKAEFKGKQ